MWGFKLCAFLLIMYFSGLGQSEATRHETDFKLLDNFVILLKGFDASEAGRHDLAIGLYTQVIETAVLPARDLSTAHRARGDAYFRKGFADLAIKDYERSLAFNPHNVSTYINRSNIRTHQGNFSAALEDLAKAIRLDPHDPFSFQVRGNVHFYMGHYGRAVSDYRRSLGLNPSDLFSDIWLYLAKSRAGEDGRPQLLTRSKKMNSEVWPAPVISLFVGDISPAELMDIAKIQAKSDHNGIMAEAYFYTAEYYLLRGKAKLAAEYFRRIIAEGSSELMEFTAAKIELERLKY